MLNQEQIQDAQKATQNWPNLREAFAVQLGVFAVPHIRVSENSTTEGEGPLVLEATVEDQIVGIGRLNMVDGKLQGNVKSVDYALDLGTSNLTTYATLQEARANLAGVLIGLKDAFENSQEGLAAAAGTDGA